MASDLYGFTEQEVLNKVLNTTSESFKVDIVSGSEYAEDSAHTDADTGQFILGVRNDTLAALGGTDGDYVPFQMNSSGALFVEAAVESGQIKSGAIASGAVSSGAIASGAVASGAVASGAVASGAIASGAVASGAIASGAVASGAVVDGAVVTLGAKADAKSTATDTTSITAMQVLKQISASVQETATDTGTIDSDTDAIKTAVEIIDNAVHVDDAAFTLGTHSGTMMMGFAGTQSVNSGDAGAIAMETDGSIHIHDGGNTITVDGTVTANLGTTDNAVLDAIAASLALLDNSIASGNELQVDVVAALPAGDNNIGNVDIVTLPASTNTIEVVGDAAEDAAVAGNPLLAGGRYDATQRTLDDGDAGALALDPSGALYTREYTGQDGAVYTTASSDVIVPPTGKAWVAIQMLEDTTFDSSGGLIAVTATKWFNTEDAAGDLGSGSESTAEGSGGKQISNSITFPQGMTIFGRWSGIDVNSGSVIAYIGDY